MRPRAAKYEGSSRLGPGTSVTPRQRVGYAAQQALILDLLTVALPLCLPGLLLRLARLLPLRCFFHGFGLTLLSPAFFLYGFVPAQRTPRFFGLAFHLVVHGSSFTSSSALGVRLLVGSAYDVLHGNAAFSTGSLNLVEVHAELLGLLLRGLRGVRLLLAALLSTGSLLGRLLALLRGLLPLLGRLACRVLSLLGRSAGRILGLTGGLAGGVLGLACDLSGLVGGLTGHLLRLVGGLSCRVLRLLGRPAGRLLGLACDLSGLVGRLTGHLLGLIGGPTRRGPRALP